MKIIKILVSFILLLSLADVALAETGPLGFGKAELTQEMETDRPDFTEGTQNVQAGHLQTELGYTFITDEEDGIDLTAHSVPELLLRAGLTENLELRIAWEGYVYEEVDDEDTDGLSDMSLGFKNRIVREDGYIPDLSFIGELGIPVGSSDTSSDELEVAGKLLWAYGLEPISVAGNINFATPIGEDGRYLEFSSSLALGTSLTESIGTYAEYFGLIPTEENPEDPEHYLNGGFTFLATENLQFDVRAGFGLNESADDFFTGIGASFRL